MLMQGQLPLSPAAQGHSGSFSPQITSPGQNRHVCFRRLLGQNNHACDYAEESPDLRRHSSPAAAYGLMQMDLIVAERAHLVHFENESWLNAAMWYPCGCGDTDVVRSEREHARQQGDNLYQPGKSPRCFKVLSVRGGLNI
ncbi:unnamed protein product [Pleuronectes platessa]|uniref:Uncharacterized protein n=1 Tax=Pleuronectes platessa TaxID=8262 RepID=A0A9N7YAT0_PLEPL|nr:unnamed protein product [Pleuronectes platessa]